MSFLGNTPMQTLTVSLNVEIVSRIWDLVNVSVIYLSMLWTDIQLKHLFKIKGYLQINCSSGYLINIASRVSNGVWLWLLCRTHSSSVHSVLGQIEIKGSTCEETSRIRMFRVWLSMACQTLCEVLYSHICNPQKILWGIILHILWV